MSISPNKETPTTGDGNPLENNRWGYHSGIHPHDQDRINKVINLFSKHKTDRLLDIGCGDGSLTLLLKERVGAKEVFGIEMSSEGMEAAQKRGINSFKLNVEEENLPFEDGYFDAIF